MSELVELKKEAHLNIYHVNSDRVTIDIQSCVCENEASEGKISYSLQDHLKDFQFCQGWKLEIR